MDWVLPSDEILAKIEKTAAEERKAADLRRAAVSIGSNKPILAAKAHDDFVSRLLKFVLPFKRYFVKLSPPIPAGLEPPGGSAG
jgi:hypothetical protein